MVGHELPGERWGLWDISSGDLQVDVIAGDFRLIKEVLKSKERWKETHGVPWQSCLVVWELYDWC